MSPGSPGSRISRVNRALSRRLAKGKWPEHERSEEVVRRGLLRRVKGDTSESVWHLSEFFLPPHKSTVAVPRVLVEEAGTWQQRWGYRMA
jgi:hypothetical protein